MPNIFKYLFIIFSLLFAKGAFAIDRYLSWVDPRTELRARIDLESFELLVETQSQGWLNQGKIKLETGILNHIPARVKNDYFLFDNGNRIRFTIDGTGQVYDYYPLKRELIRIDKTFHSGYNFLSNKFVRNGILYSIGGVGFWNYSSSITYFDEKLNEWEILRPKNKLPIPIVDGYQGYDSQQDVYYSGGSEISVYLEDQKTKIELDFFLFDFKKNEWEFQGKLNPDLPLNMPHKVLWTGNYFLHFQDGNIYVINPKTNEVHLYKNNKKSLLLGFLNHVDKDTITIFWDENKGPIQKVSITEIRSQSVYWGEFYSSGFSRYWHYLGLTFIIVFVLFLWWRQSFIRKNKVFSLTAVENKLLLKLLELKEDEYLTTHNINDILETNDKSQENQRRIRFNVITELNNKLSLKFGYENGIDRKAMQADKRLIVYVLNPKIRSEIKAFVKK